MRDVLAIALAVAAVSAPVGRGTAQTVAVARPTVHVPAEAAQPTPLRVEVLDGTRFRDVETKEVYRLYGIDTCVPDQMARLGRQSWPCGAIATAWLVTATLGKWLSCTTVRLDGEERLARCASAEHPDLAADMLREGVAVTHLDLPSDAPIRAYEFLERDGKKAHRGLWASSFEMPWDYRQRREQPNVASTRAGEP